MMDYQLFKQIIEKRLKEELPPIFSDYEIRTMPVKKVNEDKDAITLVPPKDTRVIAVPTLYMDEMYAHFRECEDLDAILRDMISIFVNYTGFNLPVAADFDFNDKTGRLAMNLISTELNEELLENVPHTEYLDMSIVYRFIISEDESGFGTVLLTNDLVQELSLDMEEVNQTAYENTKHLFPAVITRAFDNFYIMTNTHILNGATTVVYSEYLEELAEKIGSDYYVIPGSIHEIYAVPAHLHKVENLLKMLKEGNYGYAEKNEILSGSIYLYSREKKALEIAGTYSLK